MRFRLTLDDLEVELL